MKRTRGIVSCTLTVAWIAILLSTVTPATRGGLVTVDVNLALTPPAAPVNAFELTVTAEAMGTKRQDSDTADVTGNVLAALGIEFDPVTHAVTTVDQLEFTGGRINLSNVQFALDYSFFGKINASGTGLAGTLDTPDPPKSVTDGKFDTDEHLIILNGGEFQAAGTGAIGDLFEPMTFDLAATPIEATADLIGTLNASLLGVVGGTATYAVTMTLPVDFDEEVYNEEGVVVSVAATGAVRAAGQFTRSVSVPGSVTLTWDGAGDGLWSPSGHWTGGTAGQVPARASNAAVPANAVSVDGDAEAYALSITGTGGVHVDEGKTLAVGTSVTVGENATLDVAGVLTADSAIVEGRLELHDGGKAMISDGLSVAVGGRLSGNGTVEAKTIAIDGVVSPGNESDRIGTLTIGKGTMTLAPFAAMYFAQVSLADATPGADLIEISEGGSLQLGGLLGVTAAGRDSASSWSNVSPRIVQGHAGSVTGTGFDLVVPASHVGQGAFLRDIQVTSASVDLDLFVALAGDADGDKKVWLSDWAALRTNFGNTGEGKAWTDGNFDPWADDKVWLSDWAALRANFGNQDYTEGGVAAVPEPGTIVMLLGALAALAVMRYLAPREYTGGMHAGNARGEWGMHAGT